MTCHRVGVTFPRLSLERARHDTIAVDRRPKSEVGPFDMSTMTLDIERMSLQAAKQTGQRDTSHLTGSELDRKRHTLETTHELNRGLPTRTSEVETRFYTLRAFHEQPHGR